MAIAVRTNGVAQWDLLNTQTATVSRPAGTVTGDLMVATWTYTGGHTVTTPTGWTAIATGVGNATNKGAAFYRVAQAGDVSWSFSLDSAGDHGGKIQTFSGVDGATPIDATGTTSTNTASASITANAVTVVTDQAWHAIAVGSFIGRTFSATNFTVVSNGGSSANEASALLYNTTAKATGSTGTVTVNLSAGSTTGQVLTAIPFAIRPANAPTLTAAVGTFAESGQAANFAVTRKVVAAAGTFAETGRAANLVTARKVVAAVGTFTETGRAALLARGKALAASSGTFAETGVAAAFRQTHALAAAVGAFLEGGQAAVLSFHPAAAMNASVRVEWHYPLSRPPKAPTGFRVYAGVGTPDYSAPLALVPYTASRLNTYHATLTGLVDGTTYAIGVRAYNASGEEANIATASVTAVSIGPGTVDSLAAAAVV